MPSDRDEAPPANTPPHGDGGIRAFFERLRALSPVRFVRALLLTLIVALAVRHGCTGMAQLEARERQSAQAGQMMFTGPGDVWLRDLPKLHQTLDGRWFVDPHFRGEPHWYPPLNAWAGAVVARVTRVEPPAALFRWEVIATSLFVLALGVAAFVTLGPAGTMVLPLGVYLGWVTHGSGLYPIDSARGAWLLTLTLLGGALAWCARAPDERGQRALLLWSGGAGLATGALGLWNGAAFFTTLPLATLTVLVTALGARRSLGTARAALGPVAFVGGLALLMSLLVVPQLLRYGTVRQAESARLWLSPEYAGGTDAARILQLPFVPRGLALGLIVTFFIASGIAFAIPGARARTHALRAAPFGAAYLVCMLGAHAGFALHDPRTPRLASFLQARLPAPPHGFLVLSHSLLPVLELLAIGLVALLAWRLVLARLCAHRVPRPVERFLAIGGPAVLAVPAMVWLLFAFPTQLAFYSQPEDPGFVRWAHEAKQLTKNSTVFIRWPGRLAALAGFRVLQFGAPDHANHYVYQDRMNARAQIDAAVAGGRWSEADELLARYGVRYFLQFPNPDAVADHCGGAVLMDYAGFRLRPRVPCHP